MRQWEGLDADLFVPFHYFGVSGLVTRRACGHPSNTHPSFLETDLQGYQVIQPLGGGVLRKCLQLFQPCRRVLRIGVIWLFFEFLGALLRTCLGHIALDGLSHG